MLGSKGSSALLPQTRPGSLTFDPEAYQLAKPLQEALDKGTCAAAGRDNGNGRTVLRRIKHNKPTHTPTKKYPPKTQCYHVRGGGVIMRGIPRGLLVRGGPGRVATIHLLWSDILFNETPGSPQEFSRRWTPLSRILIIMQAGVVL